MSTLIASPESALASVKRQMWQPPSNAFFGSVSDTLHYRLDPEVRTLDVAGDLVRINPAYFMKHTPARRLGVIFHEILHVVCLHEDRLGDRDPARWYVATDLFINLLLKDWGVDLPRGGLVDEKYRGMSEEAIYQQLR